MHRRSLFALICATLFTGCSNLPLSGTDSRLGFSAPPGRTQHTQAGFARGSIVLVPPKGFCIDSAGIRRTGTDGFAMMARCDAFGVRGFFGNRSPAVITATIGAQPEGAPVPTVEDLARLAGPEHVRDRRGDLLLPLVRLDGGEDALPGAAPVHWRGALVLDGHILSVALYAPVGSAGLQDQGAMLLNDLARRTLEASMQDPAPVPGQQPPAAQPVAPADGPLRPRPRPDAPPAADSENNGGWFDRLASIFS